MRKFLLLTLLSTIISSLLAHEFWLQPDKFIYKRGEPINIKFLVGENFEGENWKGDSSKVNSFTFYYGAVKDEIPATQLSDKGDSLQVQQYDEGTSMLTFNSRNSYIILDSAKFNAYLTEDGLADAIEYRKTHNETDSTGREYYQRSVKTIFQVGTVKDETYKQTTYLPLDIIPLSHPYKVTDGSVISFKILFQNKPLTNAAIKIWHRVNNETIKQEMTSDENGTISFPVSTNGRWMVSCVKMIHIEDNPAVQWQSYWGSCTWGYY
jgi:uncharacterized GH25 family protein